MLKPISCRLLAIDEGRQQLSLIDTATDTFHWTLDLSPYPLARDLQRLDARRVLVGYDRGFFELDIESGRVLAACARWTDVTAVRRRPDGSTLVTGWNLDGTGGVNVLTLDRDLHLAAIARRDGDYVRLMRTTPDGTYLLCTNDHILETGPDLSERRRFAAPGFEHAWKAERLEDGTTLVAAGYGAFMVAFDAAGNVVHRFGDAAQVPAEVDPFFYASFEQLPNGHLLVANWQGHGPDNGHKGRQLLEFDAGRQLIGAWSAPQRISSLQGILVV
ncbi:hypothetical protein [Massilia luteola]|uniref:hypothetical protein n=1 Tax=Massilia luteola TaxID=3081751 RepID=UPI002ACBF015|nr:hypothetical protein [Massilia sp. Gc5]